MGLFRDDHITPFLIPDHGFWGRTVSRTAGHDLAMFDACYVGADEKMEPALATAVATMPMVGIAITAMNENDVGDFLLEGFLRDDSWAFAEGAFLYVSRAAEGIITDAIPATAGDQVQVIGYAWTPTIIEIYRNPVLVQVP